MSNTTDPITYAPAWVPEPQTRGTWGILYSCLFTLSLCVWSAIHLNIPPRGESWFWQWTRKTKWVLIAIFAPEVVLYSAWQQHFLARRFSRALQNICRDRHGTQARATVSWFDRFLGHWQRLVTWAEGGGDQEVGASTQSESAEPKPLPRPVGDAPPPDHKEVDDYSITYAYFAISGGFIMNIRSFYDQAKTSKSDHGIPPSPSRKRYEDSGGAGRSVGSKTSTETGDDVDDPFWVTVTPSAIIEFAKTLSWKDFPSHFSTDKASIRDKSKADPIAKVLVLFQVTWTVFNSTSRVALGYPISVLEVHTLAHAGCAVCMYGFWVSNYSLVHCD